MGIYRCRRFFSHLQHLREPAAGSEVSWSRCRSRGAAGPCPPGSPAPSFCRCSAVTRRDTCCRLDEAQLQDDHVGKARAAAAQANLVPLTQWPSYGRLVLEWRTLNSPDCRAKIDFIATVNLGHIGSAAVRERTQHVYCLVSLPLRFSSTALSR